MSALAIENVSKHFGTTRVLDDINIEIDSGDFLILVGPSGCGKSTLLNMLAGLEPVTEGEIRLDGERINERSPRARNIAMVFQFYALYPNMTVRGNIQFGLKMRRVPKAEQAKIIDQVASLLQIEPLLGRKPAQLSGGQRQRVAIGRALARDPALFLLDEPLSNLDAKLRVEMRTEIKMLQQRLGKAMVYVTHDQIEAMTLGNRIAVMNEGVVQQLGSPHEIYNDPANRYVASFIGSPAMNFIPANIEQSGDNLYASFATDDGRVALPVDDRTARQLSEGSRTEVTLGIRPEHVRPAEESDTAKVACPVNVVEPTGPDTFITSAVGDTSITARTLPGFSTPVGANVDLWFNMDRAVFFAPEDGKRIA
ncbi:ABC transporter ATP-binding protein [Salinisphaera orenii]|uniref:ABC transporter ATP-binding protein n=1 Tax=Salinisphaera orenii TaxID=856731 RepID=UPI000DBE0B3C